MPIEELCAVKIKNDNFFSENFFMRLLTDCPKKFFSEKNEYNILSHRIIGQELSLEILKFKTKSEVEKGIQIRNMEMIIKSWIPERQTKIAIVAWMLFETLEKLPEF
ncbi:MAG TPA: hypothetical protein PKL98_00085 [Candidatus Pacearchaeota archaeon]|nr:hypothetical protein [Candidatus Pacearchaeota archaeon]